MNHLQLRVVIEIYSFVNRQILCVYLRQALLDQTTIYGYKSRGQ